MNAAPESVDVDEFESGGLRWASRLPAGDSGDEPPVKQHVNWVLTWVANTDRSLLALHSSAYSAASVCTGDRRWQWRLCSLRLLVRCNQDDESERFTRCLFKALEGQDDGRQNEVFVALLNVVDQIGHDQCVTSSLKWLYRAVRLACIRSDRNTLRRLLGVIDSISRRDPTLQELASWWRILAREGVSAALAASSRALSMSHESDSVALESFRLGMDIVRRQFLAVNAGDCSTGMALISLVDQNPDLASHFSILFEKSSDALSNLEYLIRCFQCSFHVATCAIERQVCAHISRFTCTDAALVQDCVPRSPWSNPSATDSMLHSKSGHSDRDPVQRVRADLQSGRALAEGPRGSVAWSTLCWQSRSDTAPCSYWRTRCRSSFCTTMTLSDSGNALTC